MWEIERTDEIAEWIKSLDLFDKILRSRKVKNENIKKKK
jgi:hypothetical protein